MRLVRGYVAADALSSGLTVLGVGRVSVMIASGEMKGVLSELVNLVTFDESQ